MVTFKKSANRSSLAPKERKEVIGETLARVQYFFKESGFAETTSLIRQHFGKVDQEVNNNSQPAVKPKGNTIASGSELTIYHNAEKNLIGKRNSSSSEEGGENMNSSGEEILEVLNWDQNDAISNFIAANRPRATSVTVSHLPRHTEDDRRRSQAPDEQRPSTSREEVPEERADRMLCEVEQGKSRIYQTPGKGLIDIERQFVHSAMCDEEYYVLAAHLDEGVCEKIGKGQYLDFAKLVPKDRLIVEEEQKLQMLIKNGQTFWVPVNEGSAITGYAKWLRAFRI